MFTLNYGSEKNINRKVKGYGFENQCKQYIFGFEKNNRNVEVLVEGREEKRDHCCLALEMVPGWRE